MRVFGGVAAWLGMLGLAAFVAVGMGCAAEKSSEGGRAETTGSGGWFSGLGSFGGRSAGKKPNIIFIMADDLGYGDVGVYGQRVIKTPRLDRMAGEGMVFTDFYAGATVCASSRSVLMTGLHTGRTRVRGNAGPEIQTLVPGEMTVARLLGDAGYSTALVGKWGLGDEGNTGHPNDQGFDFFYGYMNQVHAHNYYPEFLWRNDEKEPLGNEVQRSERSYGGFTGGYATKRVDYSHDLFMEEAVEWVEEKKGEPFFLYLALTIPHANNEATRETGDGAEVPEYGIYADEDWPDADKGQAAMITRMDEGVGRLMDRLRELGIARNTLVIFTSDNGPHDEAGHDTERFDPNGPLRGFKRDLHEGGIRVPTIAWWPGTVEAGSVSDHIGYSGDLMATAAELAGVEVPSGLNSVSLVPTLRGRPGDQKEHHYLYWEFYEQGGKQAVRWGDWKAVRFGIGEGAIELYDLSSDLGESRDVALSYPDVVRRMEQFMLMAHRPDPAWKVGGQTPVKKPAPGDGVSPFGESVSVSGG